MNTTTLPTTQIEPPSPSQAMQRAWWEPPVFDYSRFEEDGDRYYVLHRHPKSTTSKEEWYEETDVQIEWDVLEEYKTWLLERRQQAEAHGSTERLKFYTDLHKIVDEDTREAQNGRDKVVWWDRIQRNSPPRFLAHSYEWDGKTRDWTLGAPRSPPIVDRDAGQITADPSISTANGHTSIELHGDQENELAFAMAQQRSDFAEDEQQRIISHPPGNSEDENSPVTDWGFNFCFT